METVCVNVCIFKCTILLTKFCFLLCYLLVYDHVKTMWWLLKCQRFLLLQTDVGFEVTWDKIVGNVWSETENKLENSALKKYYTAATGGRSQNPFSWSFSSAQIWKRANTYMRSTVNENHFFRYDWWTIFFELVVPLISECGRFKNDVDIRLGIRIKMPCVWINYWVNTSYLMI